MSLLTGEPRAADVIATEETEVLQIKKEALKPIIEDNPALVESFSEMIQERRELLKVETDAAISQSENDKLGMLSSIKKFFGLK